jgi:hypothetical protein
MALRSLKAGLTVFVFRVSLVEEEAGLGDAIKRVAYAMGIKPCGGCEKRVAALNRWVHFMR